MESYFQISLLDLNKCFVLDVPAFKMGSFFINECLNHCVITMISTQSVVILEIIELQLPVVFITQSAATHEATLIM